MLKRKKATSIILALLMFLSLLARPSNQVFAASKYSDVQEGSIFQPYITYLTDKGHLLGYRDGEYKPERRMTRAEVATTLARIKNLDIDPANINTNAFKDTNGISLEPYIYAVKEAGIFDGYEDGNFYPDYPITRAQTAKVIVNALALEKFGDREVDFEDIGQKHWAAPYIHILASHGVISGFADGLYKPDALLTRGQMSKFLTNSQTLPAANAALVKAKQTGSQADLATATALINQLVDRAKKVELAQLLELLAPDTTENQEDNTEGKDLPDENPEEPVIPPEKPDEPVMPPEKPEEPTIPPKKPSDPKIPSPSPDTKAPLIKEVKFAINDDQMTILQPTENIYDLGVFEYGFDQLSKLTFELEDDNLDKKAVTLILVGPSTHQTVNLFYNPASKLFELENMEALTSTIFTEMGDYRLAAVFKDSQANQCQFNGKIKFIEVNEDWRKVKRVEEDLEIEYAAALTNGTVLPEATEEGVSITWQAADPQLLSNDNKIISDTSMDKETTLTASIQSGDQTINKEFHVNVLSLKWQLGSDEDFDGNNKYIKHYPYIVIPNEIYGKKMTSYHKMFQETQVKGVVSINENIVDMSSMFYDFKSKTLDLRLNTSQVKNMEGMFSGAIVKHLDLSSFDTGQVTNMAAMFLYNKAESISFGENFNTSNVTTMHNMFAISHVKELDLSSFDTSQVTDMSFMFKGVPAARLDLSTFKTSKVNNMSGMFQWCEAQTIVFGQNFDSSKVTDMSSMFEGCHAGELNLLGFDTRNVTNMASMFELSKAEKILFGQNFKSSNTSRMDWMFAAAQAKDLDFNNFDTSNVVDMRFMFAGYQGSQLDLSSFNLSEQVSLNNIFSNFNCLVIENFEASEIQHYAGGIWTYYEGNYQLQCQTVYLNQAALAKLNNAEVTGQTGDLNLLVK